MHLFGTQPFPYNEMKVCVSDVGIRVSLAVNIGDIISHHGDESRYIRVSVLLS